MNAVEAQPGVVGGAGSHEEPEEGPQARSPSSSPLPKGIGSDGKAGEGAAGPVGPMEPGRESVTVFLARHDGLLFGRGP